jgi:hypothetical protein
MQRLKKHQIVFSPSKELKNILELRGLSQRPKKNNRNVFKELSNAFNGYLFITRKTI